MSGAVSTPEPCDAKVQVAEEAARSRMQMQAGTASSNIYIYIYTNSDI